MNRTAWKSVVITGLVLCVASLGTLIPRLRAAALAPPRLANAAPGWRAALVHAAPTWHWNASLTWLVAVLAAAATLAVASRWIAPREPRRRVIWLAARGHSASRIARRTGLAQDAVRAFLRPASPSRPAIQGRQALPSGRNVRSVARAKAAPELPKWLKKRTTTALGRAMFVRHSGC